MLCVLLGSGVTSMLNKGQLWHKQFIITLSILLLVADEYIISSLYELPTNVSELSVNAEIVFLLLLQ